MFIAAGYRAHSDEADSTKRVNGYYRAGSDFRKDGEAVGW